MDRAGIARQDWQTIVAELASSVASRAGRAIRPGELAAIELACKAGRQMRQRDFISAGIHQQYIAELVRFGAFERPSRGCYRLSSGGEAPWGFLATASLRWPGAIACGPTAAAFHDLVPDTPGTIWLATGRGRGRPEGTIDGRTVIIREWMAHRIEADTEAAIVDGVGVRVAKPAAAVAELMELSKRIGPRSAYDAAKAYLAAGGNPQILRKALEQLNGRIWRSFAISDLLAE